MTRECGHVWMAFALCGKKHWKKFHARLVDGWGWARKSLFGFRLWSYLGHSPVSWCGPVFLMELYFCWCLSTVILTVFLLIANILFAYIFLCCPFLASSASDLLSGTNNRSSVAITKLFLGQNVWILGSSATSSPSLWLWTAKSWMKDMPGSWPPSYFFDLTVAQTGASGSQVYARLWVHGYWEWGVVRPLLAVLNSVFSGACIDLHLTLK